MEPEQAQLESLWNSTAGKLRSLLLRWVSDPNTADDLLSQTFLEAARHWRQYAGRGSRQAWLFGIARNLVRRERRTVRPEALIGEPPAPDEADAHDTEASVVRMRAAIAELPEHLRTTLTLRLADELRYEEIAAALDLPIGTVRSRLHEAVRRLRKAMAPEDV